MYRTQDDSRRRPDLTSQLFFSVLAAAALGCLVEMDKCAAQIKTVVAVSPADATNPNEVSIAINPRNRDNIVAVAMVRDFQDRPGYTNFGFHSLDGGKTWGVSPMGVVGGRTQGDDAVRFTADGIALRTCISFLGIFEPRPSRAASAILLSRSADGGATWDPPVALVTHENSAEPMEDKPYLTIDNAQNSPHFGHVYVAWTRFDRYGSEHPEDNTQIIFARSTDGGQTFQPPFRVSDAGGDCRDSDDTVEGVVPAVGVNGEVFLVWAGPRGLEFDVSADGGQTFAQDRVISDMPGGWDSEVPGCSRHNGMPVTGVDHSSGRNRGRLYVNWIDNRHGDLDVFVASSGDAGQTWTPPLRVNDDPLRNGKPQFFSWMAVDPVDGSVNLIFLDRREAADDQARVTLARSVDGGQTFRNYAVDFGPFQLNAGIFLGDYTGIDAYGGRVAAAFTHTTGDQRQTALAGVIADFKLGELDLAAAANNP